MKILLLLATLLAQEPEAPKGAPKEPPKITIEEKGPFRALVKTLESRFSCSIKLGKAIADKEVSINVKDAGFFEALDALCRSHQEVTYLSVDRHVVPGSPTLVSEPWLEFPSSYSGHYKTVILSMLRTVKSTPGGNAAAVEVTVATIAPPWVHGKEGVGTRTSFSLQEATNFDGKSLVTALLRSDERIRLQPHHARANLFKVDNSFHLKDFDLSKGVRSLAGRTRFSAQELGLIRLSVEVGSEAELPLGKLRVESVEKDSTGAEWRIEVGFTSNEAGARKSLDGILAREGRHDGDPDDWTLLRFKRDSVVLHTGTGDAPRWVELRTILSNRAIDVPFRFNDVEIRGK